MISSAHDIRQNKRKRAVWLRPMALTLVFSTNKTAFSGRNAEARWCSVLYTVIAIDASWRAAICSHGSMSPHETGMSLAGSNSWPKDTEGWIETSSKNSSQNRCPPTSLTSAPPPASHFSWPKPTGPATTLPHHPRSACVWCASAAPNVVFSAPLGVPVGHTAQQHAVEIRCAGTHRPQGTGRAAPQHRSAEDRRSWDPFHWPRPWRARTTKRFDLAESVRRSERLSKPRGYSLSCSGPSVIWVDLMNRECSLQSL